MGIIDSLTSFRDPANLTNPCRLAERTSAGHSGTDPGLKSMLGKVETCSGRRAREDLLCKQGSGISNPGGDPQGPFQFREAHGRWAILLYDPHRRRGSIEKKPAPRNLWDFGEFLGPFDHAL